MFCLRRWRQWRAGMDAHALVMHPPWALSFAIQASATARLCLITSVHVSVLQMQRDKPVITAGGQCFSLDVMGAAWPVCPWHSQHSSLRCARGTSHRGQVCDRSGSPAQDTPAKKVTTGATLSCSFLRDTPGITYIIAVSVWFSVTCRGSVKDSKKYRHIYIYIHTYAHMHTPTPSLQPGLQR